MYLPDAFLTPGHTRTFFYNGVLNIIDHGLQALIEKFGNDQ